MSDGRVIRLTAPRAQKSYREYRQRSRDSGYAEERAMPEGSESTHAGSAKELKPRLIFWEVTKGCNLRCIHCRATATELMSPADLPTAKALDIIKQIADFGNPIFVLSAAGPFF